MRNRNLPPALASLLCLGLGGCLSAALDDPLHGDWGREPTFAIGGRVQGAKGVLTLQNSNGTQLTVAGNGAFAFETPMVPTAVYNVTIAVLPRHQTCTVGNGSGTVGKTDVRNVIVTCS